MNFHEEQAKFERDIKANFISLFALIEKISKEHDLKPQEAGVFLLTRLNKYFNKLKPNSQICYELAEPPFKEYTLPPINNDELIEALNFFAKNGRFRSVKKAKKYGLLLSELNIAFSNEVPVQESEPETTNTDRKDYNLSERETHLQMIAVLAEELAKIKGGKYKKANGLPNNLILANLIETMAREIEIEALKTRSVETYRRRLTEISNFYKGE